MKTFMSMVGGIVLSGILVMSPAALAEVPVSGATDTPILLAASRSGDGVDRFTCKMEERRGEKLSNFC